MRTKKSGHQGVFAAEAGADQYQQCKCCGYILYLEGTIVGHVPYNLAGSISHFLRREVGRSR